MVKFYSNLYEINPLTMAVVSELDEHGKLVTRIVEENNEFLIDARPIEIIQQSCKYFGASLKGRQEGAAAVSGSKYKVPIAIDTFIGLYFFPTHSPANLKCSWISHSHIETIHRLENSQTALEFKNRKRIILDVSYGSMLNQIQRTAQFRYSMDTRLNQMRKKGELVAENSPSTLPRSLPPFFELQD